MLHITLSYCTVDKLHYIYSHEVTIHTQKKKPTLEDINNAVAADQWNARFKDMRNGIEVRVSERIWDDMFGSVPPINVNVKPNMSFFCGEPYSEDYYYYFESRDGFKYGSIKNIKTGEMYCHGRSKAEVN